MQQEFLNIAPFVWNIIFLVIRYVLVVLLLAYLTNVFVKKKDIHTDLKGRALEWRVDAYKTFHRWVMQLKNVIASPNQIEVYYRDILSFTKFKIGMQGVEYASFFDTPERLFQFGIEFDRILNKEEVLLDYNLKHKLVEFQYWLDDLIVFFETFARAEYDEQWGFDKKTVEHHCQLACRMLGIALQKDVNKFGGQIDDMLRDRLRNLKITGVNKEPLLSRVKKHAVRYCEGVMDKGRDNRYEHLVQWFYHYVLYGSYGRSQLLKNQYGLMTIFILVHFEEQFARNPETMKNNDEFMRLASEYQDCYSQYLKR